MPMTQSAPGYYFDSTETSTVRILKLFEYDMPFVLIFDLTGNNFQGPPVVACTNLLAYYNIQTYMFCANAPPRGNLGWYKSRPVGPGSFAKPQESPQGMFALGTD